MANVTQNVPPMPPEDLPTSASAQNIRVVQKRTKGGCGFLLSWTGFYTIGQVVALIILAAVDFSLKQVYFLSLKQVYWSRLDEVIYTMLIWALYGTVVGAHQWRVLRKWMPQATRWIAASTVGYAVGGAALPLIFTSPQIDDGYVRFGLIGLAFGTAVGIIQQLLLRRHFGKSYFWILANSVSGIGFGLVLPMLGGFSLVFMPVVGAISGIIGGLLTGTVLASLIKVW